MVSLVKKKECGREETAVECNETTYYANNLHWQNVALSPHASPLPNIRGFKEDFIRNLQREITSYFPEGSFKNFLIFDNRKFPEINDNVENFGTQEIVQLANSFNLPPDETSEEWATLLQNLRIYVSKYSYLGSLKSSLSELNEYQVNLLGTIWYNWAQVYFVST